jgi:hypothetical protein
VLTIEQKTEQNNLIQEFLGKVNAVIASRGFSAYIDNEEWVRFRNPDFFMEFTIDPDTTIIDEQEITGFEEDIKYLRKFFNGLNHVESIFFTINLQKNFLKIVGGPKEYDLIHVFCFCFCCESSRSESYYKEVTFNVPLGVVCDIQSPKMLTVIEKLFFNNHDRSSFQKKEQVANAVFLLKKELKTQLITELMEELEKEIE